MNIFNRRLSALESKLPPPPLPPDHLEIVAEMAGRYDLDADELAADVAQTLVELAAAGVTDPDAQVRYLCQRDGLDADDIFAELYGGLE